MELWKWKLQQLCTKQVSSHFKQEYTGRLSERAENVKASIKLTILEEMVEGYHECSFRGRCRLRGYFLLLTDDGGGCELGLRNMN